MITIADKQYPCRITMGAMLRFKRQTGKEIAEINQENITEVITFVYCCTASAASADGVDFTLTLDEFADNIPVDQAESILANLDLTTGTKEVDGGSAESDTTIHSLLGLAMGCIGIGLDDFCRCTPSEFYAIFDAWNSNQTATYRTAWEQTRFLALATLQPHSRRTLRPADIMPLPWENTKRQDTKKADEPSPADILERYKQAKQKYGL